MPNHNDVPTTCTASLITGWDVNHLGSDDPKARVNAKLQVVTSLQGRGYKRDFKMLHAITTQQQIDKYKLDEFLPTLGFKAVFVGVMDPKDKNHREKDSGSLTMWCVMPRDYEAGLKEQFKVLTELKNEIDPPKKPDPARQKFPDLKLSELRKAGLVFDNASVDNPIHQILKVPVATIHSHILIKFGFDIAKFSGRGADWTKMTTRQLKTHHLNWKAELV